MSEPDEERPTPRPAFRTGAGGNARPAPTRLASFTAALPPARQTAGDRPHDRPATKPPKKEKDEIVTLTVKLPRSLRKQLRGRAEAAGYSAEDAAYHLIRSWLQT